MMNPRERVRSAFQHVEPDRPPVDLGGGVSTLTYGAYINLVEFMSIEEPIGTIGEFKVMTKIDEHILESLNIDFRHLFLKASENWQPKVYSDGTFEDEWGIKFRDVGYYTELIGHPLADANCEDLENFEWPDFSDKSRVAGLREEAEFLYNHTDFALAAGSVGGRIFEQAQWLRGMQKFMEDLASNKNFAALLMDKLVQVQKQFFDIYLDAIGDYIELVCMGDDLGTQSSLLISPEMYREMIKPRQAELYSYVKTKTKAKIMHHSCGAVYPLVDDLIDIGVDILNPIQPLAKDMDRKRLKKEFGTRLSFWGGVDEQKILPFGSKNEVRREIIEAIQSLGKDGGFVLAPAHNIQPDVPPENILTMYKTATEKAST